MVAASAAKSNRSQPSSIASAASSDTLAAAAKSELARFDVGLARGQAAEPGGGLLRVADGATQKVFQRRFESRSRGGNRRDQDLPFDRVGIVDREALRDGAAHRMRNRDHGVQVDRFDEVAQVARERFDGIGTRCAPRGARAAQVDGDGPVALAERRDRRHPDRVIRAPTVHEEQRNAATRTPFVKGKGGSIRGAIHLHRSRLRRGGAALPERRCDLRQKRLAEIRQLLFADARDRAHRTQVGRARRTHRA